MHWNNIYVQWSRKIQSICQIFTQARCRTGKCLQQPNQPTNQPVNQLVTSAVEELDQTTHDCMYCQTRERRQMAQERMLTEHSKTDIPAASFGIPAFFQLLTSASGPSYLQHATATLTHLCGIENGLSWRVPFSLTRVSFSSNWYSSRKWGGQLVTICHQFYPRYHPLPLLKIENSQYILWILTLLSTQSCSLLHYAVVCFTMHCSSLFHLIEIYFTVQ